MINMNMIMIIFILIMIWITYDNYKFIVIVINIKIVDECDEYDYNDIYHNNDMKLRMTITNWSRYLL